jgi:glycosyltransferase involved in cell wall biosynthesis
MTGIDRVEAEYMTALLARDTPLFALVRLTLGFAILDCGGIRALADRLAGKTGWGRVDAIGLGSRKLSQQRRAAEADVRRLAIRKARRGTLARHLADILPPATTYLNIGHSNIDPEVLSAVRSVENARITVMIHDTIPLDFPQFQRPKTVARFATKFRLMVERADLVICPSNSTRRDVQQHMQGNAGAPDLSVAHLGVRTVDPAPDDLPDTDTVTSPYFVTLGTIEPRKNHLLLLDVWRRLAGRPNFPRLIIVGRRGWNNRAVFDRLDQHPPGITEFNALTDGAVAALLQRATGLLFPSFSEGFGLPAAEAASLGLPVICSDLPVFREILGEYPIYAAASDLYAWETKITELANNSEMVNNGTTPSRQGITLPTWDDHFNLVLRLT